MKCFETCEMDLSQSINVLVGANNAGKSTIIKSAYLLQNLYSFRTEDIRLGFRVGIVELFLSEININQKNNNLFNAPSDFEDVICFRCTFSETIVRQILPNGQSFDQYLPVRPQNYIYPHLSNRKADSYLEVVNSTQAYNVLEKHNNLVARVDNINNPDETGHTFYKSAMDEVLGFKLTTFPHGDGKQVGITIKNGANKRIKLDQMGSGVAHVVDLIDNLYHAEGNLFLIEELENDLHPKALKALLELIIEKSRNNQFIISTHSNIVLKILGGEPNTKVFSIDSSFDEENKPTSICTLLDSSERRINALKQLGYELQDYYLWESWLLLEESSAERIIREFLIKWFCPSLQNRLRTIAAEGADDLKPRFISFSRMFTFLHLEENMYINKAWCIADGDEKGRKIIGDLKKKFVKNESPWSPNQFLNFSKENFEEFYPSEFQDEASRINKLSNTEMKRKKKKELLDNVIAWIYEDEKRAIESFEETASEVIKFLKKISVSLGFS